VTVHFTLNGEPTRIDAPPATRLADALRDRLRLTGTKIGCNAGDCGACTVLLDGKQVAACLTPLGQVEGRAVITVEGLSREGWLHRLQLAFQNHGAAQCGICTPGMLMAAVDLLARDANPSRDAIEAAIGGVLCRCTGYQKIVEAIAAAAGGHVEPAPRPEVGAAVGARAPKVDGLAKVTGREAFGADRVPDGALWLRVVRSPHASAAFELGDVQAFARRAGLVRVLTWRDIPGRNGFGIYPDIKDQPVLAENRVRYRGEAVLALVGERAAVEAIGDADPPISWILDDPLLDPKAAEREDAPLLHSDRPGNVLARGRAARGDVEKALATSAHVVEGRFTTRFVEHAYIEPEAGWAVRKGGRIEVTVTTQTPYMDKEEVAGVLGLPLEAVRIIPTACGGGFGGKLDQSVQPLVAVAAWLLDRPVACVYTRPESIAATTKRHPSEIALRLGCDAEGNLTACDFSGVFNTGAYASWGPTVAGRVPVHATGPYRVPHLRNLSRAIFTNLAPAGAFRGFGVPQSAIANEALMDELAAKAGLDPLEFRLKNALRPGDVTATGQVLGASVGLVACLRALEPHWKKAKAATSRVGRKRRGVGLACMWYGIGNTALSNPSTMRVGLSPAGRLTLYSGAVDIGQGSNTILRQIAADALGVALDRIELVAGDTDLTEDAGKTSASRQTFVSGKATQLAGENLRANILRLANAGPDAVIDWTRLEVEEKGRRAKLDLWRFAPDAQGDVLSGVGRFDPPTTPLDADGQGTAYATYAFAAQMAEVEVDMDLGTTKVLRIVAAHDVGRAVNPTQVEGQIQGGIAQGLGLALMEEWWPGKADNLHDYLIPTVGDMPAIETILIESPEPLGPYGAKGVGEPGLVPTAPAILAAIREATGARIREVPMLPHRLRAAILEAEGSS